MALATNSPAYLVALHRDIDAHRFTAGWRVKTLKGGIDGGEDGEDRHTPPGTVGYINDVNHVSEEGEVIWDVWFPNGACWNQTAAELADRNEYELSEPETLLEASLRLSFGYSAAEELTMYDMTDAAEIVTTAAAEIVRLVRADAERTGWHLFYIVAGDMDGEHGYIVSADSESELKAEELARAAVLDDDSLGTDEEPGQIMRSEYLGAGAPDVFYTVGLLAA